MLAQQMNTNRVGYLLKISMCKSDPAEATNRRVMFDLSINQLVI